MATTVPWALWGAEDPAFTVISDSPLSETYAFSAAWGDYDGDGFQDLLCLDSFPSGTAQAHLLLFTNQRNGAFAKSTLDPSMLPPGEPPGPPVTGATWGDYDNDGRLDILVNGGGWFHKSRAASFLLHQEADHTFAPAPPTLFPTGYSYAGLWADFDCDGMLDVFMGRWNSGAESNPTSDVLFRGTGSGWFVDIQAQGIYQPYENTDSVLAGTVGDFNGDGAPDVIVTTVIPTGSRIYLNNGDLSFARFLVMPDWLGGGFGGGVAAADYDNDGDLDFVSVAKSGSGSWSCACDGTYAGFCQLWRNDGTGDFERTKAGELGNLDWIGGDAAAWADYNNDGWQDLLVFRSIHSN
ncbi:MAG: VCBS repeat-containing protein, partial [Verrucomicrobiae bacterium]|nr:VCBS repeat-containing protein [Verrucomicrobiae bacterium]